MSTEVDPKLSQPFQSRRSVSSADARMVRKIDAGIFAKLLPHSTKSLSPGRPSSSSPPSVNLQNEPQSDEASTPWLAPAHELHPSVTQIKKETLAMKAYRTESPYYFSSRQLLPAGSLVFFSNKIRRYVHPTDGILFDSHPRLQSLSDAESQTLEEQWRDALANY
jgi:hypothetical protein